MQARLDPWKVAPDLMGAMLEMEKTAAGAGLEYSLYELVKTRASQINGCAYCLHMHTTDARKAGESEMRLYLLNAWRESSLYTPRERAALAWTESLTLVSEQYASDDVYEALCQQFSERERVALTLAITTINAWNRIAIGFRSQHP
ncbi:Alkylhydroperoxidase AhpD core [gamma proteobacterium HdN1]|nr:Alkylhydroperoxidase AhpD core [gamma proteobacterium HdN1]